MKNIARLFIIGLFVWIPGVAMAAEVPVSDATSDLLPPWDAAVITGYLPRDVTICPELSWKCRIGLRREDIRNAEMRS